MYMDVAIPIPNAPGKLARQKTSSGVYLHYILERTYNPNRRQTVPKRVAIGRIAPDGESVHPNEKFFIYFPNVLLPELRSDALRCSTLSIGPYIVIEQILKEYGLARLAQKHFGRYAGLFLDLAAYMVIEEQNQGQHYPSYAYRRAIFTDGMRILSDSTISKFLADVTEDQIRGFLDDWNADRDHKSRIYISYDSTNKNSQAGDVDFVEFGKAKVDQGLPIFNVGLAYDKTNQIPLFYELYPGSIPDVSQFRFFVDKAISYNYRNIGFIIDRGYFSKENIEYMDENGFEFIIMVKGRKQLVSQLIEQVRGTFEDKLKYSLRPKNISGITIRHTLFDGDTRERYFHLFFSPSKKAAERREFDGLLDVMEKSIKSMHGTKAVLPKELSSFFDFCFDDKGLLLFGQPKAEAIDKAYSRCGYFCIVTSERMSAKEAYELYRSRDVSEKIFCSDKTFLGSKSMRVHSSESVSAKMFVEFVGLIIRQRMYSLLKNEMEKLPVRKNYMTVPAAMRELDKIEVVRLNKGRYQLDHAVTKTQETILRAFALTKSHVMEKAAEISAVIAKTDAEAAPKPEDEGETADA